MKKIVLACAIIFFTSFCHAFFPSNGTWVVTAENNGQPGRGFTIQNQAGTMIILFYGYAANGQPDWYLAAGALSPTNTFTGTFQTYAGGITFGGATTQATNTGSAGTVSVAFTSSTTGTMTLPGEAPKSISWANFGDPSPASSLTGTYALIRGVGIDDNGNVNSSATNVTASGLLQISGTSATQSLTVTASGIPSTTVTTGSINDLSSSFVFTNSSSGTQTVYQIIERGDNLVLFTNSNGSATTTRWYRISAVGTYAPPVIPPAN